MGRLCGGAHEISGIKAQLFLRGWGGVGGGGVGGGGGGVAGMKFSILEKFANLMKDLKYEHQSVFSLWGRVKLNFRDRYGKPNICLPNG